MEEALLQARALIESTVSLHRRRTGGPAPVSRTDADAIGEALEHLVAGARRSVSLALTATGEFAAVAGQVLARPAARQSEGDPARPGTAPSPQDGGAVVRVLCVGPAAESAVDLAAKLHGPRVEVRVSETDLREVLIVDGRGALVRSGAGRGGGDAVTVNDPAVVRALDLLFAGAWSRARPLVHHLGLSPRLGTDQVRRVLEMLREGHTDETAAQELNVSLRTYRRHVAEIMRELGANSRFQAGARAVELGLLSGHG
ncbi:LuxR C-terminal-related transcriptional regulator [Kitasatospora aureofaciens]|uniref:helix-turn-helix transcriptional regulator n=1 Tax=Kitasatospora aureofaciens TaxID=1894 RepID=UPI0027E0BC3B|nr:LuxR C-terminal-related transcriptional regulator [Kitasatospora aureofaciens]